MIDFSDDFRQSVYVESSPRDPDESGAQVRVVLNGEPGPWYESIYWYDSGRAPDPLKKERYSGFLGDHFYYVAGKAEDPHREYLILDGIEYGPYIFVELLPTYDDKGRIIWVARPDYGVMALYTEGVLTETTSEQLRDVFLSRRTEPADLTDCSNWRPGSDIVDFDVFKLKTHCLYRVPTAPFRPRTWWLALDGEPISEDLEMIGKVVVDDDQVKYGALDRNKLIVVTVPLGQPLAFDDPPLEYDYRVVLQAAKAKNAALCEQAAHDEFKELCRSQFEETKP